MKLHATCGTDIADVVLFSPELLPVDFDEQFASEPHELVERLRARGVLVTFPCNADGEYRLALFVNEPVPDALQNYCQLAQKIETLQIAGELWFSGGEFMFRDDRSIIEERPGMSTQLSIPAGTYFAEVFTTEIPDAVYEAWLHEQAGESAQRLWWVQTWFASVGIVALMVCVGCLFFGAREAVIATAVISAALLGIAWLLSRTASYARVQQARRDYGLAYPDFVVRLRSLANP